MLTAARVRWSAMAATAHGIDLVVIPRIQRMLDAHGDRFLHRVFTKGERAWAMQGGHLAAQRLAARFACKEAVMKALGTGWGQGVGWTQIDLRRDPLTGAPTLVLSGAAQERARWLGIDTWLVSLSHAGEYAMASVIGQGTPSAVAHA